MPGIRPTMGGPGQHQAQDKTGGTLGTLMPMYTLAIIVFFVYTTFKVSYTFLFQPVSMVHSLVFMTKFIFLGYKLFFR